MEAVQSKSFLESELYTNAQETFTTLVKDFCTEHSSIQGQIDSYLEELLGAQAPKDNAHQEAIYPILEQLIASGQAEKANLLFNVHRTLTELRGYSPNKGTKRENVSQDVATAFNTPDIPEEGLIVIDFFVTQNLPAIIDHCKEKGIDLNRIRVCVPKLVLATQLMGMNETKRQDLEEACKDLTEDQFILTENHNAEFNDFGDQKIALWFAPRVMAICASLQENSEEATIENYCNWFRKRAEQVTGIIFAPNAFQKQHYPFSLYQQVSGERQLTKVRGYSQGTAEAIARLLIEEMGFTPLHQGTQEYDPKTVDQSIDHSLTAKNLHLRAAA